MRKTWPPQVGKGRESGVPHLEKLEEEGNVFPPRSSLKKNQACRHLDWSPVRSFGLRTSRTVRSATTFVLTFHSGDRKRMQTVFPGVGCHCNQRLQTWPWHWPEAGQRLEEF